MYSILRFQMYSTLLVLLLLLLIIGLCAAYKFLQRTGAFASVLDGKKRQPNRPGRWWRS
jgi:lauroyl/myristoyl acyltransferase